MARSTPIRPHRAVTARRPAAAASRTRGPQPGAVGPDGAALVPQDAFGGYGPDRMQRMAYTNWVEAFFEQRIATQKISLTQLPIVDASSTHSFLDADIAFYGGLRPQPRPDPAVGRPGRHGQGPITPRQGGGVSPIPPGYLAGATVLCVPDLAYALQATPGMRRPDGINGGPINFDLLNRGYVDPVRMQVQVPMMQGLFLMEQGPFLRSYGADHHGVDIRLPERFREWVSANGSTEATPKLATVDRHLGSSLAHKALYCALKKHGVFNWVPDGICLSKYATGPDGYADDHFDARSGQLLNIGVQGPCITKTWAMGDSAMHAMPGDKVFMLVIGTVDYEVGERVEDPVAAPAGGAPRNIQDVANDLWAANAKVTRDLAREGFTEDRAYDGPNRARPNAARYATRNNEAAVAEAARRVLYGNYPGRGAATRGSVDVAKDALDDWLSLAAAAAPTQQSNEFKSLVDAMNNLRAVADPATTGEASYMAYREAAVSQLKAVQNAFSGVARANVTLGTNFTYGEEAVGGGAATIPPRLPGAQAGVVNGAPAPGLEARNLGSYATATPLDGTENSFGAVAADVRAGRRPILKAELSNIHLMRATSSFLSNASHFDPNDLKSRCGLKIGYNQEESGLGNADPNPQRAEVVRRGGIDPGNGVALSASLDAAGPAPTNYYPDEATAAAARAVHPFAVRGMRSDAVGGAYTTLMPMPDIPRPTTFTDQGSKRRPARSGTSEFIVGAWCIGTVTDSAASRAVMHANQVRTAPSSMAINVNVNVEWWDSDMLYQKYMDQDRGHYYEEGDHPAVELARKANLRAEPVDNSGNGGFNLSPTVVQKPQHTVMQRNEPAMRNSADYARELQQGSLQTKSSDAGARDAAGANPLPAGLASGLAAGETEFGRTAQDAVANAPNSQDAEDVLRGLAIKRLSTGRGEYEGVYVQPDVRGVNDDPDGLRIYDLRTRREADYNANGYVNAAADRVLVETRHWSEARNSFIA